MENPFTRHEKAVLFFSGGKDSLACLHMLRPYWDRMLVVWVNPGAALRETREQMEAVRAMVPSFYELAANVHDDIALNGFPVDLMPAQNSLLRAQVEGAPTILMRPWQACCMNNLWEPARVFMERLVSMGYTLMIRGQKNADPKTPRTRSGDRFGAMELWYPIEDWSERQVFDYLAESGVELPEHYEFFKSSLDCWACTAHMGENIGKLEYLRQRHPEEATELRRRIIVIRDAVMKEVSNMNDFLSEE